ncbi:MAG: hypothetical protein AAF658_15040, partial [Myxococcota bacterium]
MYRTLFALTLGLALLSSGAAHALEQGDTCELTKKIRVSAKNRGKGKKRNAKKGSTVEVLAIKKKWAQVQTGDVTGWVKLSALDKSCTPADSGDADPAIADEEESLEESGTAASA